MITNMHEYIATFPVETQLLLEKIRNCIKKAAPNAIESINYGIPTFVLKGNLVHFAAYKKHIGFYPGAGGIASFKQEISKYKNAKGSVQFPIDQPLPLDLVTKITKFRVIQNLEKDKLKNTKTCRKGHQFYKSSDCPSCPICEKERNKQSEFFVDLGAPAKRALESKGITSVKQLSEFTESEILSLHGMGKSSLPKLNKALLDAGLSFK